LYRIFEEDADDEDDDGSAEATAHIEHAFCWEHKSIIKIPDHEVHIDVATLDELRDDPRAFLESDMVISDEALSMVSDVSVYRTSDQIPASEKHGVRILGTMNLTTTGEEHAPRILRREMRGKSCAETGSSSRPAPPWPAPEPHRSRSSPEG